MALQEEVYNAAAKKVRESTFNAAGLATRVVLIMSTGGAPSNSINGYTCNSEGKLTREENKRVSNPAHLTLYGMVKRQFTEATKRNKRNSVPKFL